MCGEEKRIEEFPFRDKAKGTRLRICLECRREQNRAAYWANPELARKAAKVWRLNNADKMHERYVRAYQKDPEKYKAKAKAAYYARKEREAQLPEEERERLRKMRAAKRRARYEREKARKEDRCSHEGMQQVPRGQAAR